MPFYILLCILSNIRQSEILHVLYTISLYVTSEERFVPRSIFCFRDIIDLFINLGLVLSIESILIVEKRQRKFTALRHPLVILIPQISCFFTMFLILIDIADLMCNLLYFYYFVFINRVVSLTTILYYFRMHFIYIYCVHLLLHLHYYLEYSI